MKPGEKVGLVGRSGAGKSTLVNLLLRFYDLESGRILIDGQDIAEVTQEIAPRKRRRGDAGYVAAPSLDPRQHPLRPAGGQRRSKSTQQRSAPRPTSSSPALLDPNGRAGYDAHVGERGVKLSGGQRQRVAIARLILKDAPILVLDEATSALDSEVEATIQEQLYGLMKGRTVIAIAHRLSTIAVLDRLVVMDEGASSRSGTHQELLRQNGLYAALWQRQSGGFLGLDPPVEQAAAE